MRKPARKHGQAGNCEGCGRPSYTAYCDRCAPPPEGRGLQWVASRRALDDRVLPSSLVARGAGYRRCPTHLLED